MNNDHLSNLPTDRDLQIRLRASSEDSFVERKTFGDWRSDAVKTVVAFANSTPIGYPAVLFIGVKDDGTPQDQADNLDKIQKTLSEVTDNIYPPAYYFSRVIQVDGKDVLAVIVPGSPDRPHFAGAAYVRSGTKSVKASEELFGDLIAQRTSISGELLKWKGKRVTLSRPQRIVRDYIQYHAQERILDACNTFYVTLSFPPTSGTTGAESFPISALNLSYDNKANRLTIHISDSSFAI